MAIVYRTAGPWGGGSGADLAASVIDTNFWTLVQDIAAINAELSSGAVVSISTITVSGNQMTVVLTNSATLGPYTLPTAAWNPRGAWQPLTAYAVQDVVVGTDGNLYLVIFNHVSQATFSANANDGMGHNYYKLLLPGVEATVPQVINISADVLEPSLIEVNTYFRLHAAHTIVIIPDNALVAFPINTELHFRQGPSAGPVIFEIASGSPVALNFPAGFVNNLDRVGATCTFKKVATDEWDAFGLFATHE